MIERRGAARAFKIALISILAAAALGASDSAARFDKDSHAIMCICGCDELLGECNHVSCPDSGPMRTQLVASIAAGKSDDAIFHEFQQEYGPAVLAAPMFTRFNHLAWIMPPLVLLLGIAGAMFFVRKWKVRAAPMPPLQKTRGQDAIRNRIRRETQL